MLCFGLVVGCSPSAGIPLAPVVGTATYDGQPLDHGEVVFLPCDGTLGSSAVGAIQADSQFVMRTGAHEGAAIGRHKVTVHCRRTPTENEARNLVVTESLIPERYWKDDKSPLVFEVKAGETNLFPIVLEK